MKLNGKSVSLPISKIHFSEVNNQADLTKVTLMVCKNGEVESHGLFIEEESLSMSEESIRNKPLLCAYEIDEYGNKTDFKGHEMEYKIIKDGKSIDLKIEYIEQPVGVIPESCNFRIEEIDGDKWVVVDAYLFNEYCGDAVRILEESDGDTSVSMEINVLESFEDEDDGLTHITKFKFTGITLLGLKHPPAISGANIKTFAQSNEFSIRFSEMVERINKIIIKKEGGEDVRDKIIEKFSALEDSKEFKKIVSNLDLSDEELEKQLFSLSVNDLESRIREKLKEIRCSHTDYCGDTYETQKYWLCDVLVTENIAIVEDNQNWYKNYGIPYEFNGDSIVIKEEEKKRYIRGDWRMFNEGDNEPEVNPVFALIDEHNKSKMEDLKCEFEKSNNDLNDVKAKFTDIQAEKSQLDKEILELRELKNSFEMKEKEAIINDVVEKFEELKDIEGYDELIAERFEIPIEELETKLKVLAFDNGIILNNKQSKKNFSKQHSGIKIPVGDLNNAVEIDPYGGILDKFISKNK